MTQADRPCWQLMAGERLKCSKKKKRQTDTVVTALTSAFNISLREKMAVRRNDVEDENQVTSDASQCEATVAESC